MSNISRFIGNERGDGNYQENDGCPTEVAVLKRFWREMQAARSQDEEVSDLVEFLDNENAPCEDNLKLALSIAGRVKQYVGCKTEELREQVKKLEALVVMRCDLDVPPQFSQGLQSHEFLEPVTAEHCQWFVAEIEKLRKERETRLDLAEQNKQLKAELKSIDGALNDPRANLTLTTPEIIWELKEQNSKLKAENEDWRNNRYTSLWKLRTEDRDKTIESQRQLLLELREERGNLCAINRELQKRVEGMLGFVVGVSEQTPEKPDYWSSCSQCERNSSDAEDLLELPNAHHTVDCTQALS